MHIYVHTPFCRSKCAYCDFYSVARPDLAAGYTERLLAEWEERKSGLSDCRADTLYIGGGTPSSLPPDMLLRIIRVITSGHQPDELTVEANPDDVTPVWADAILTGTPVNRISMGVQSLVDSELTAIGRRHDAAGAVRAVEILRSKGLTNLSLDLIYGLPGQTMETWRYSLDRLLDLRPEHISAYLLSYEPGTLLTRRMNSGLITEAPVSLVTEMYDYLCRASAKAGYNHYEISNFALPGHEAVHNSSYWDYSDYIGLGPGAHSFLGGVRGFNTPDVRGWHYEEETDETVKSKLNDLIITSLRTSRGLSLAKVKQLFGARLTEELLHNANPLIEQAELLTDHDTLKIPERYWLRSDYLMRELILT